MASKPPVDPTRLPPKEPDDFPPPPGDDTAADAAQTATGAEGEATNEGFNVPASPAIQRAERVLASHQARAATLPPEEVARRTSHLAGMAPVSRNFHGDSFPAEDIDTDEQVMDLMSTNVYAMAVPVEPVLDGFFREFREGEKRITGQRAIIENDQIVGYVDIVKSDGQIAYEAFMHEPIIIRVHSTKDKNAPWLVFVGVNGDNRWLPRNKPIRLQRKFVERLAAAQEMAFETRENKDPNVDNAMELVKSTAAAFEFSVLHDPNPLGRRWLGRITRQGS